TARAEPSGKSDRVGVLRPHEHARYLGSVPSWREVVLPSGTRAFVPKRWTELLDDPSSIDEFEIHFLDVGTGDAAILDVGNREMIVDGGDGVSTVADYVEETGIIQDPIELAVVTHGDTDHWRGLRALIDGPRDARFALNEFWEPGYDRICRPLPSY